jgi:hypothetical protein
MIHLLYPGSRHPSSSFRGISRLAAEREGQPDAREGQATISGLKLSLGRVRNLRYMKTKLPVDP